MEVAVAQAEAARNRHRAFLAATAVSAVEFPLRLSEKSESLIV
jgi:hypothetical protein